MSHAEKPRTVFSGTIAECEKQRLARLIEKYGTGHTNLPFPTLGGKQLWEDRFIFGGWRVQKNIYTDHARLLDPTDVRRGWGTYEQCRVLLEQERLHQGIKIRSDHLVLLVHGLGRSKDSFGPMRAELEKGGYQAESVNYPSTRRKIDEHARQIAAILDESEGVRRVSFVTHSLGGIVVRKLLAREDPWRKRIEIGRVVMLAPPNRGSIAADIMKDWFVFEALAGESGIELTRENLAGMPPPPCEFGVIAGGKGNGRGYNPLLPGDNDAVVAVANTRLNGMADFLVVNATHTFIMSNDRSIRATLSFLQHGKFRSPVRSEGGADGPGEH